jgi:hypothetical protein
MLDIRGLMAGSVLFGGEHLATRESVEAAEQSLSAGKPIPLPPDPLPELYRSILQRIPLQTSRERGAARLDNATQAVASPSDSIQDRGFPQCDSLSGSTAEFMNRTKDLIEEANQPACLVAWRHLYARTSQAGFTVAVAGEFNRGKSTLINKLLGKEILPIADLPTTAMVTRVLYGPEAMLWHILPGPRRHRLELSPDSWQRLVAKDEGSDPEGVAQVELPNPWLQQTGIQFVDTPGAGDLTGARAALAIETIAHCDAVLVAVSATMPLSLTERSFVDEHVLARRIPRVAVVLTRVDQVPEADRAKVVDFVKNKLREWAPGTELWCVHGVDVVKPHSSIDALGPAAILQKLASWSSDPDHLRLRRMQVLSQLDGLLVTLEGAMKVQVAAVEATDEDRQKAERAASEDVGRRKLDWEDLRLEMGARERATGQWLEKAVQEAKTPLVEALCYEAQHAPNPKEWWEKDLPYRLRRELLSITRGLNSELRNRIAQDAGWLYTQAKQKFSWTLNISKPADTFGLDDVATSAAVATTAELNDLSKMQLIVRLGIGAVTIASFIHPAARLAGLSVGMIGGIISEKLFRGKAEEQRSRAAAAIPRVVEDVVAKGIGRVLAKIRGCYCAVATEVVREETLWFQAKKHALAEGLNAEAFAQGHVQAAELRARLGKIGDLRLEITNSLKGGKP